MLALSPGLGRLLLRESEALLLLGPRIRERFGEAGDREIRWGAAINDRCDDPGRNEGEGCQQADVPFALGFTLGNLGEGGALMRQFSTNSAAPF